LRFRPIVLTAALCAAVAGTAFAQKDAPRITRDTDRDGVPDLRDRCPGTPPSIVVNATGCVAPVPLPQEPAQPLQRAGGAPTGGQPPVVQTPAVQTQPVVTQSSQPDTAARRAAPPAGLPSQLPGANPAPRAADSTARARDTTARTPTGQPANPGGGLPAPVVVPPIGGGAQPANPGAQPAAPGRQPSGQPATPSRPEVILAAVGAPSVTGGFFMPPSGARSDSGRIEYLRIYALRLDSAISALVEVFRGTAPPPLAQDLAGVSSRVRDRWDRCRRFYFDLASFGDAMVIVKDSLPANALLARAATGLTDGFENTAGLQECDNIASALEEPARWSPWADSYATSMRNFFREWYPQLRAIHEANRSLGRVLNGMLPAERRLPSFGALPPTPPTVGN